MHFFKIAQQRIVYKTKELFIRLSYYYSVHESLHIEMLDFAPIIVCT